MTFDNWMATVEGHLQRMVGKGRDDLMDWCYWDCWNDGDNPLDVALHVMRESGYGDFS